MACGLTALLTVFLYISFGKYFEENEYRAPSHQELKGVSAWVSSTTQKFKTDGFYNGAERNVNLLKVDWHNYNFMQAEVQRTGLGENGKPAAVPTSDEALRKKLFDENGFNGLLSDRISLNRSIADIRHKSCAAQKYLSELPTVSIIVPFYNEHWSTLLRTCYSVLNRSPPELIKEIILVDDHSTKDFLGEKLDKFIAANLPKVKVVRLPERSGLIVARMTGARLATADVLLFLDSHTEANTNWLPPLLDPMAQNYRVCVCPFIDVISYDTFEYRAQDEGARGAFDWQLYYKRLPLLPDDLKHPVRPFRSPIMAGGLFAITAKFFWELDGYDEGLDIWGGEQYELSFKIWQCGGEMYDAPCSRVGHIYRGGSPFSNPRKTDYLHKNYKRVAEVWMDEYKQYVYDHNPGIYSKIDPGDLTRQLAVRDRLQCKPFKWFMEEIAFDLPLKYPPVDPPDFAEGAIRNVAHPDICVDSLSHGADQNVGMYSCASDLKKPQQNQYFALTWHKDIRLKTFGGKNLCWDVPKDAVNTPVQFYHCHLQMGNQLWRYNLENKWVIQGLNNRCLDCNPKTMELFVNTCDPNNKNMQWEFGTVNRTMLDNYDTTGPKYR